MSLIDRYPQAIWMPAHDSNYRKTGRASFNMVVLHVTDGRDNPRATARMWQQPNHKSSAHFVIGPDGTVIQSVSIADVAWHAHDLNGRGVGIEHCARTPKELGPDDPGMPVTSQQLRASAALTIWLCKQGQFEPSAATIVGHGAADKKTSHSACPEGAGLIVNAYIGLVHALLHAPFA